MGSNRKIAQRIFDRIGIVFTLSASRIEEVRDFIIREKIKKGVPFTFAEFYELYQQGKVKEGAAITIHARTQGRDLFKGVKFNGMSDNMLSFKDNLFTPGTTYQERNYPKVLTDSQVLSIIIDAAMTTEPLISAEQGIKSLSDNFVTVSLIRKVVKALKTLRSPERKAYNSRIALILNPKLMNEIGEVLPFDIYLPLEEHTVKEPIATFSWHNGSYLQSGVVSAESFKRLVVTILDRNRQLGRAFVDEVINSLKEEGIFIDEAMTTQSPEGGIDLSQQDSAIRVTRDASGGVQVDVDPALIARVEREGLTEVDPVIINMRPADIQSLFGIGALAKTPVISQG